jgi:hypothetical protein
MNPENNTVMAENKSFWRKHFFPFVRKNLLVIILALVVVFTYSWFSIKVKNIKSKNEEEKVRLITKFQHEKDSLNLKNLEFASRVFSWAIRSEMLRNNIENLNQLVTVFVQQSNADVVNIIDASNNIIISSDKKVEGTTFDDNILANLTKTIVEQDVDKSIIYTPIMGFNSKLGVLVVIVKK